MHEGMVVTTTETLPQNHSATLQRLDQSIQRVFSIDRTRSVACSPPAPLTPFMATTAMPGCGTASIRCSASGGLALAHRREQGQNSLRAWELEQRVVALMRGLMRSMMRQAEKVERFKQSLNPLDALHAKYDSCTGEPVVADDAWGHLQLDATSLFLLQLAQLTKGDCAVVQSRDEVDFLQNLVHYIARALPHSRLRDLGTGRQRQPWFAGAQCQLHRHGQKPPWRPWMGLTSTAPMATAAASC